MPRFEIRAWEVGEKIERTESHTFVNFNIDNKHIPNISTDAQIKTTNLVRLEINFSIVIPADPQRTDIMVKSEKHMPMLPITMWQCKGS